MNTIFIGGSRHIARLPTEVKKRLDNVIASGHRVIIGDANGADKAVQKYLLESRYERVTVFCSGSAPRNNLGPWRTRCVDAPKSAKGVHFYTIKDREMAREADFGLMIWDGKSPGTLLNVLRLVQAGKIAVLFHAHDKVAINIKSADQWRAFLSKCSPELLVDLKERATPEEWAIVEDSPQPSLLGPLDAPSARRLAAETPTTSQMSDEAVTELNRALASGDPARIVETLGSIARNRGMRLFTRESGLARESLGGSPDDGDSAEFATIIRIISSIGLRLEAKMLETVTERPPVHAHTIG
jgi:probable addiction module antidote protein